MTQIDLEYRLLPWDSKLDNGEALKKKFGDDVGFRFYPEEDWGIFWSNNPAVPIDTMVRWLGIWTEDQYEATARQHLARGPRPGAGEVTLDRVVSRGYPHGSGNTGSPEDEELS